ncbi:hypothetical protein, partial [Cytobacillus oceanisediminis]|uniref:hypothetical protein n=1 Tax=Cytobacillus oceanisediminis TaxID=665099 RepID=UPI001C92D045
MLKKENGKIIEYIEWGVVVIVSVVVIEDGVGSKRVYDGLIVGWLWVVWMVVGMWVRVKWYLFVGGGVLVLNLLVERRRLWGKVGWWG